MTKINDNLKSDDFYEAMPAYVPAETDQLDHQAKVTAIAILIGLVMAVVIIALMVSMEIASLQ